MSVITYRHKLEDVLTAATSVKLSDRDGTYGLKRRDSGEVLAAAGTEFSTSETGIYTLTFTDPDPIPLYDYWVEVGYDNELNYLHRVQDACDVVTGPPEIEEPESGDCVTLRCVLPLCQDPASWIFVRLRVRPTIAFGTVVEWLLHPDFNDPGPYFFQLQWGQTDTNLADDWEDVGLVGENVFTLTDTQQRSWGHNQKTFYRVQLTTPSGEYVSRPMHSFGDLTFREWRIAMARERIWRMQFERTIKGQHGFLLKSKLRGTKATVEQKVLDWQTDEVIDAQSEDTFGGEFTGDYGSFYAPVCCMSDLSNLAKGEKLAGGRGTVDDSNRVNAQFLASPMLDVGDVWVSRSGDLRWRVWSIKHLEEVNGVPIVLNCEMRLIPFSSVIYRLGVQ